MKAVSPLPRHRASCQGVDRRTAFDRKHEEVVYCLVNLAAGRRTKLLDFKERCELSFNGKTRWLQGNPS